MLQINFQLKEGHEPDCLRVKSSPFRIGRDAENELVIDDPSISRLHAVLERADGGAWILKDLNSRNGIVHSGERKTELRIESSETQEIYLGEIRLEVKLLARASETRSIDVSAIQAKSLGARQQEPLKLFLAKWVLGGYLALLAGQVLNSMVNPEPRTFGRSAADAAGLLIWICLSILPFVGLSKLHLREYRVQPIFKLSFLVWCSALWLDPIQEYLTFQLVSSNSQKLAGYAYITVLLGVGAILMVRLIFPSFRLRNAIGLVALGAAVILSINPISRLVANHYWAEASHPPDLSVPLASPRGSLDTLFAKLDEARKEVEEVRKKNLELR